MLQTYEAIYKDGKIELQELPTGIKQAKILVTFLEEDNCDLIATHTRNEILGALRSTFRDVSKDHSLADELISERRKEAGVE